MAAQIVEQLLNHKIDRIRQQIFLHSLSGQQLEVKCLTCRGIYPDLGRKVTDSGQDH
jgi:hypothetical protein